MDGGSRSAIPLAQLRGWRIAEGAVDPRGWDVCSGDGRRIGDVYEVLVDPSTRMVRYLDVEVENVVVTGRERHVLVPVARARTAQDLRRTVLVEGLAARAVGRMPTYTRGTPVHPGDAAAAPYACDVQPNPAHEPLALPIHVERPLIIQPIRLPARPAPVPAPPPAQPVPAAAAGPRAA
jgi:sporulation protein YlmC with PRC-barrel domain